MIYLLLPVLSVFGAVVLHLVDSIVDLIRQHRSQRVATKPQPLIAPEFGPYRTRMKPVPSTFTSPLLPSEHESVIAAGGSVYCSCGKELSPVDTINSVREHSDSRNNRN